MKGAIACFAVLASLTISTAVASPPADPMGGRTWPKECAASQARCDAYLRDYLAYTDGIREKEEKAIAVRKERVEALERESQITQLPTLNFPAKWRFKDQVAQELERKRPRVEGLSYDWNARFYIDKDGRPFHSSVVPTRVSVEMYTYKMEEVAQDRVQYCEPLSSVSSITSMKMAPTTKCFALESVTFTPAKTAAGTPIAARVLGKFSLTSTGLTFAILEADPVLFASENVPSQAWRDWQEKEAADAKRRQLIEQDAAIRRQERLQGR